MSVDADFEHRLIGALQPIRYGFLAGALCVFLRDGLAASLAAGPVPVTELATRHDMDPVRLDGLLRYLANEGYVALEAGRCRLTRTGAEIREFEPWYRLLVGGYAGTVTQIGAALRTGAGFASRDGTEVGIGSCGISEYDAIPLVLDLLDDAGVKPGRLVDIGCGDGRFLMSLLARCAPEVTGVGVDPVPGSIELARAEAARRGLADRLTFQVGTGTSFAAGARAAAGAPGGDGRPDCYVASFVLQEILAQDGVEELVGMVRQLLRRAPEAVLAVVEVDHRPADPAVMRHGLGLAYYNPYYLMHRLTEQRLELRSFWERLFAEAGLRCLATRTADPAVDSTGLEIGYLLAAS
jgi:2-ketoarginine methyltransferase